VGAATALVCTLPGSLIALAAPGAVTVSDILLASSALGIGLGLVTMPFIDFHIVPNLGLDEHIELGRKQGVAVTPTAFALPPPASAPHSIPVAMGVVASF